MLHSNRNQPFFPPKRFVLSALSVFIPLLNSGLPINDPDDLLSSADWVGPAEIEFVSAHIHIEIELGSECIECTTEWRLGFRSIDSEISAPEVMLSHTMTEVWWDENINWQYPNHLEDGHPFTEQNWISHQGNIIRYTIPLSELPETLWTGFDIGLYRISTDGNDWFGEEWSDDVQLDEDGDALNHLEEYAYGTLHTDADSDDDGLLDGVEISIGTLPTQCDTDGDGLTDGLELGVTRRTSDTNDGCFIGDRQPSTTTDPLVKDSDGGGLEDGEEDVDQDGLIDLWETDPRDPNDDIDADQDGILDALEDRCVEGFSTDADGDSLPDVFEGWLDTDEDGTPNFCDDDDDNDGISSLIEGDSDWDEDGIINAYDTDSDDDGIFDVDESIHDLDCDEQPSWLDDNPHDGPCSDSDLDGLYNPEEEECGTDPFNPDTDGDGILDVHDCPDLDPSNWNGPEQNETQTSWETGCGGAGIFGIILLAFRRYRTR